MRNWTHLDAKYCEEHIKEIGIEAMAMHFSVKSGALRQKMHQWREDGYNIPDLKRVRVGEITTRLDRGHIRRFQKTETGWVRLRTEPKLKKPVETAVKNQTSYPIGHISTRIERGRTRDYIKTNTGWERTPLVKKAKEPKMPKPQKVKIVKETAMPKPKHVRPEKQKPVKQIKTPKPKHVLPSAIQPPRRAPKKEIERLPTREINLSARVPVYIPERRMTVYVKPGVDVEAVKQKYLKNKAI